MNHFDPRTSRALMERRLNEADLSARNKPDRKSATLRVATSVRVQLGERLIAFGERLVKPATEVT